jgi:hypothetical protein
MLETFRHADEGGDGCLRSEDGRIQRAWLQGKVACFPVCRPVADAIIIAQQGRWYTAIIRPLLAAPVVIYLWKVIVWDIVLGLGTTDAVGGDVAQWAGSIVTA